jgi:hypothetical protein
MLLMHGHSHVVLDIKSSPSSARELFAVMIVFHLELSSLSSVKGVVVARKARSNEFFERSQVPRTEVNYYNYTEPCAIPNERVSAIHSHLSYAP